MIEVGCCDWKNIKPKSVIGYSWKSSYSSSLQVYASIFNVVELKSSITKFPMYSTASRWFKEATSINETFEFVINVSGIFGPDGKPHLNNGDIAKLKYFAKHLKAKKLLFQTPSLFEYNVENLEYIRSLLSKINGYQNIWEPKGTWLTKGFKDLMSLCIEENIVLCTDPFKIILKADQPFNYYRLNGFGKIMTYNYKFSKSELKILKSKIPKNMHDTYIMFNNTYMCEDAMAFKEM